MTIVSIAERLRTRKISSVELTKAALSRTEALNPKLNAFITVTAESAMLQARQSDDELARHQKRGPLHGIPVALKDLFYTRGVVTTGGSLLYRDFVPAYDAAVVERLTAAGAVLLGKLNMHELAYGITSENPHFGAVRNPWNLAHTPGGSSGGSGAAVAAGLVFAAMGSDTGGSIRIPAAFCGTVGLKPTYGRVSRFGTLPLSYTLDHMGPLTRTVRDAALVLNAIAGHDPRDPASSHRPRVDFEPEEGCSIRGLRIGIPQNFYFDHCDPAVEMAVRGALARAGSLGAVVKPVTVPDIEAMNAVGRVILLAEAAAVLEPRNEPEERFGSDVRALLAQGRLVPATDYVNAQRLRRKMRAEFSKVWTEVDCLCTPTVPHGAQPLGASTIRTEGREEDARIATTRLVRAINLLGLPALSMPCGQTAAGMPVGMQLIAPPFDEQLLLRVGAALEDAGIGIPPPGE